MDGALLMADRVTINLLKIAYDEYVNDHVESANYHLLLTLVHLLTADVEASAAISELTRQ
jgi:hypothetical protein